jgi:hypothetical protein
MSHTTQFYFIWEFQVRFESDTHNGNDCGTCGGTGWIPQHAAAGEPQRPCPVCRPNDGYTSRSKAASSGT